MKVIEETCVAGRTIDRIIKVTSGCHKEKRKKKMNVTPEKVQKNNDRLAVKTLMRLLNANFKYGDLHIVLTYEYAPDKLQAKKDRDAVIKKLRRQMKKLGKKLKYIAVTEYKHTRIHHHLVVNCDDIQMIEEAWNKGWVKFVGLDDTGNYIDLAEYLIKETSKTIREEGSVCKRRYAASTNLIKPVVKRSEVDVSKLFDEPTPIDGYYIPKDYARRYEHEITGLEHLEYIMVALDKPRSYKVWPRGKVVKYKEYFKVNYEEEQECLF